MALLTDPLTGSSKILVDIVAKGYALAGGQCPDWQWLRWQLQQAGHDPSDTLRTLPRWQYNYRPVAVT